jgi:hypothetical protein
VDTIAVNSAHFCDPKQADTQSIMLPVPVTKASIKVTTTFISPTAEENAVKIDEPTIGTLPVEINAFKHGFNAL